MASAIPGSLKQTIQGMPYNNPSSKDLFRISSIEYPQQREVSATYAADLLSRATRIPNNTFTYSIIDKPPVGQIYLISLPPNAVEIPSDGYMYLDPEVTRKIVLPDGRELHCMERLQGFAPGDQVISRVRRRYRFANDHQDLQLLHYSVPDGRQQQIVPPPYSRHPTQSRYPMGPMAPIQTGMNPYGRPPNAISPMAIQSPGPSSMHTPPSALARGPAMGTPTPMGNSYVQFQTRIPGSGNQRGPQPGMPQTPTKPTGRRTKGTKNKAAAAAAAAAAEEVDDPSGDEIDNLKFREVAMSRFKRNHDYISEIFSAYSISSIIPPTSIYEEKNIDELKKQLAAYQADIEKLKSEHSEKVEEFKRHSNVLSKSMNDLSKCNTMEELLKLQERTEKELDIVIQPHNPVKLIQMHDAPESDLEVEGHNDLMQEDVISGELLNSEHEGLVELDQGLSPYDIRKDLVNTSEIHDTSGIEGLEGLKNIQGIEGIEGIEGMGGIDTSGLNENNLQGYFSPAGLSNDPNLQLGGLTGDPNIEDHSNYSGLTITNYGGDSSQMFNEYINVNAPDEVMEDEVPLS